MKSAGKKKTQSNKKSQPEEPKPNIPHFLAWDLFMFLLSLFVLGALLIELVMPISPRLVTLLRYIDNLICVIFIADFFWKLTAAKVKMQYLKYGWIDLICSIPNLEILRFGRAFQIFRFLRILRSIRSMKVIFEFFFRHPIRSISRTSAILCFFLVIFGSIAILEVEGNLPESNIRRPADAIWWAFVTMTTVGYGDYFPISGFGRVIAVCLMISGVGLFGMFTAHVGSYIHDINTFNSRIPTKRNLFLNEEILAELRILSSDIADLKRDLKELQSQIPENTSKKE